MTKYLNFFESESGFTEAVEAGQLFYPNVSYTEDDDTVHWKAQPANPVETPMLRMSFSTSTPGEGVKLTRYSDSNVTAMEIDGIPVNVSGDTYGVAEPGNHTAVYQFASPAVPDNLFFVSSYPFSAFKSAEIISPVTSIGNLSFDRCTHISAVTIPDSVTTIGFQAFSVCGDLTGVTIPDSVTTIGFNAFEHAGLSSVTIPDSVTSMGGACFMGCTDMLSARIGSGITALPNQTFDGCTSLQGVVLPDNLTAIGVEAFLSCYSLYDINIPSGVTSIGTQAFYRCSGLTAIYFNSETPPTLGANALNKTNNCPIYVPASSVETYKQAWHAYMSRIKPMGGDQYNIMASVSPEGLGEVGIQETASEGDQVNFNVFVFDSEQNQISSVTVTDGNGDEVECIDEGNGEYYFTMPASDVFVSAYFGYAISTAVNDDSLGGVTVYTYAPSEGDRAEFGVYLYDEEQYQVSSVTVTDRNGDEVQVTVDDGLYTFTMPASNVTISVAIEPKQ